MSAAPHDDHLAERESVRGWLTRFLKGVMVGIGFILPGLSGGVLAVIFRIYDPLIRFLAKPQHRFLRNLLWFLPVGIGGGVGVVLFSIVVEAAFGRFAAQFTCLFIGFVIGTFPSLYRTAGRQGRSTRHFVILAATALGIFALMLLGGRLALNVAPSIGAWLLSGGLIGLGVIVPGMSPSNFLIYLGLYDRMAAGIAALDLRVVVPLFLGLVVCVLAFAKAANWAFTRYYAGMYHAILGLVVGSSLAIFPTVVFPALTPTGLAEARLSLGVAIAFGLGLLVVGIIASYLFSKLEDSVADEREAIDERR
ncbi:DUF368 domain-containing protein [Aestuariimicrobium soli]|uniref:DUF368 domain-containing protein n=1 Tax=Aestuariimicrobium soli TaxID=2035834 RepID=UPI003EBCF7E6